MARFAQSGMVGVVAFLLLPFFYCPPFELQDLGEVIDLEYECIEGSGRGLDLSVNEVSLESVFAQASIPILLRPSRVDPEPCVDVLLEPDGVQDDCYELSSIHALVYGGEDTDDDPDNDTIQDPLKDGRLHPGATWPWYAFGLSLPLQCGNGFYGAIFLNTLSKQESFECAEYLAPEERFVREDFLVFSKAAKTNSARLETEVHELSHVLNIHHAETVDLESKTGSTYGQIQVEEILLGDKMLAHLLDHRGDVDRRPYVEPGEQGAPWCCFPHSHKNELHGGFGLVCEDFDELVWLAEEGGTASGSLELWLEKPRFGGRDYKVGEPVRIGVTLRTSEGIESVFYPTEISLDPRLGYLRIWTNRGQGEDRYRSLSHLLFADAFLESARLPDRVEASGIDAWFDRKRAAGPEGERSYQLRASYTGIGHGHTDYSGGARTVLVSNILEITERGLTSEEREALPVFSSEEAQLFLFMLGGDHLRQGMRAMQKISDVFPETIYAPYANLALGVNWSRPFYSYDSRAGVVRRRAPLPDLAQYHLNEARRRRSDLPPSYQRELYQGLFDVHLILGDKAADSDDIDEATRNYSLAEEYLAELMNDEIPRPISRTQEETDRELEAQKQEIDERIANLARTDVR